MYIRQLRLQNYRNFENFSVEFEPGVNLILGENGVGKTNLIEGILLLAGGRSMHATARQKHAIMWGKNYTDLFGAFSSDRGSHVELGLRMGAAGIEKAELNQQPVRKLSDLMGKIPVLPLVAEDIDLFAGPPLLRRRYLDLLLSLSDPLYFEALIKYQRALLQRNQELRLPTGPHDPFLTVLIEHGFVLYEKRQLFLGAMHSAFAEAASQILAIRGNATWRYQSSLKNESDGPANFVDFDGAFRRAVAKNRHLEIRFQRTLCGPHRDDVQIFLADGRNFKETASKGELRAAALAAKLVQLKWMEEALGERLIILVDEALHELDLERQRFYLRHLCTGRQILWAQTHLESDIADVLKTFPMRSLTLDRKGVAAPVLV